MRDFLLELAAAAAAEFAGCSVGIAVVRDGRIIPIASSDARAHRLETNGADAPHALAAEQRRSVHLADLSCDHSWPGFRRRAMAEGIRSSITKPIDIDEEDLSVGLVTVYSPEPRTFESTERQAKLNRLSGEAARALSLATRLSSSERTRWHLEEALSARATIDQAVGILMAQNRCNSATAFSILKTTSQHRNVKLRSVAREIVTRVGGEPADPPRFRH